MHVRSAILVVTGILAASGCGGDEPADGPMVDRIDDAIAAVEGFYAAPQDYFEVSATETLVSVIVAVDDGTSAEQAFWSPDDGLVEPVALGAMERPTFRSTDVDFDPDRVLDQVADELPNADIVDFAVTAADEGVVVYDARVESAQGGVLLVLLSGDGQVLGAQAE